MSIIFTDPSVTSYRTEGHAESPERVARTAERLKAAGHRLELPGVRASKEDILKVHTEKHLESVEKGTYGDSDTPFHPGIAEVATTSLSGALSAADEAASGRPAFSLMRPPGHHAGRERVAGFCFLNNAAAAVFRLAPRRVAILDIDVHHGDGTEDIVLGKGDILCCSLHQVPLYPGTGLESRGNCRNFPLPPRTGEADYLRALEKALTLIRDFKPEVLAVSAGFDTYKDDPLAQLDLDKPTYRRIGRMIAQAGLPRFAVLEGGYSRDLPALVELFLDGFFAG